MVRLLDSPVMEHVMGFESEVGMPQPIDEMSLSWSVGPSGEDTICVPRTSYGSNQIQTKVNALDIFYRTRIYVYDVYFRNIMFNVQSDDDTTTMLV